LLYYIEARPPKGYKIANALHARVVKDVPYASRGVLKHQSSLLISLIILNRMVAEFRKKSLNYFSHTALDIIALALSVNGSSGTVSSHSSSGGSWHLQIITEAANVFGILAPSLDGTIAPLDQVLVGKYLNVLQRFSLVAQTPIDRLSPNAAEYVVDSSYILSFN